MAAEEAKNCDACAGALDGARHVTAFGVYCSVACVNAGQSDEELDHNGAPKEGNRSRGTGPRGSGGLGHLEAEERNTFLRHIASLRQRLLKYEPDSDRVADDEDEDEDELDAGVAVVQVGGSEDPQLRAALEQTRRKLDQVQSELRVANDQIREHIRQKARLREQVDQLTAARINPSHNSATVFPAAVQERLAALPAQLERLARAAIAGAMGATDAGRGGRGGRDGLAPSAEAARAEDRREPADPAALPTPSQPVDATVVEPGRAAVGTDGPDRAAGEAVPAATTPPSPPADAKARREPGVIRALRELGEATTAQLVAHLGSTQGSVQQSLYLYRERVESRHAGNIRGGGKIYRLKA